MPTSPVTPLVVSCLFLCALPLPWGEFSCSPQLVLGPLPACKHLTCCRVTSSPSLGRGSWSHESRPPAHTWPHVPDREACASQPPQPLNLHLPRSTPLPPPGGGHPSVEGTLHPHGPSGTAKASFIHPFVYSTTFGHWQRPVQMTAALSSVATQCSYRGGSRRHIGGVRTAPQKRGTCDES